MIVRKAVIPAAGKGTRMYPLSRAIPKEMLPIGLKPLLQYILEEAVDAGIEEVAVILSPEKNMIKTYFQELADTDSDEARMLKKLIRNLRIYYFEQESPLGVADALWRAREFIGNEPFAYMLPDNFAIASPSFLRQLMNAFQELQNNVIGLIKVEPGDAWIYGNSGRVNVEHIEDSLYIITKLHDKQPGRFPVDRAKPVMRGFARGILRPMFFDYIEQLRQVTSGELDDVPVLQALVKEKQLFGYLLEGKSFDTGNPDGYTRTLKTWFQSKI